MSGRVAAWALSGGTGLVGVGFASFVAHVPDPLPTFVDEAKANDRVAAHCGAPMLGAFLWSGSASHGVVSVSIPLYGPKGSAKLQARAYRNLETKDTPWSTVVLTADLSTGEVVDLLGHDAQPPGLGDGGKGHCGVSSLESV